MNKTKKPPRYVLTDADMRRLRRCFPDRLDDGYEQAARLYHFAAHIARRLDEPKPKKGARK